MKDIVFTLEFDDDSAGKAANYYLKNGWTLLHVGTKSTGSTNGQEEYSTAYVVGANKEQYEAYQKRGKPSLRDLIKE